MKIRKIRKITKKIKTMYILIGILILILLSWAFAFFLRDKEELQQQIRLKDTIETTPVSLAILSDTSETLQKNTEKSYGNGTTQYYPWDTLSSIEIPASNNHCNPLACWTASNPCTLKNSYIINDNRVDWKSQVDRNCEYRNEKTWEKFFLEQPCTENCPWTQVWSRAENKCIEIWFCWNKPQECKEWRESTKTVRWDNGTVSWWCINTKEYKTQVCNVCEKPSCAYQVCGKKSKTCITPFELGGFKKIKYGMAWNCIDKKHGYYHECQKCEKGWMWDNKTFECVPEKSLCWKLGKCINNSNRDIEREDHWTCVSRENGKVEICSL